MTPPDRPRLTGAGRYTGVDLGPRRRPRSRAVRHQLLAVSLGATAKYWKSALDKPVQRASLAISQRPNQSSSGPNPKIAANDRERCR